MQKRKRGLTTAHCIVLGVGTLAVAVAAVTLSSPGDKADGSPPAKTPSTAGLPPDASTGTTGETPPAARPPQLPGTKAAGKPGGSSTMANTGKPEPPAPTGPVVVTVTGAVDQPGKFTLRGGDRVYQAIRAAGGLTENAAADTLDLTEQLRSGQKIFVPTRRAQTPPPSIAPAVPPSAAFPASPRPPAPTETPAPTERITVRPPTPPPSGGTNLAPAAVVPAPEPPRAAAAPRSQGTPVNINTATAAELQRLPGVGPALAHRILTYRKEVGKFHSPEQMLDVRGITEEKFAAMEPLLRVQ